MNKAVFFDRDGVLNKAIIKDGLPYPPKGMDDLEINEGALELISSLKAKNFKVFVFTNQPDIARGKTTRRTVDLINSFIQEELGIDDVVVCPHDNSDNCLCRKPKPGMLEYLAKKYIVNLKNSFVVGDREKDIIAGQKVKCKTIFLNNNYTEPAPKKFDFEIYELMEINQIIF